MRSALCGCLPSAYRRRRGSHFSALTGTNESTKPERSGAAVTDEKGNDVNVVRCVRCLLSRRPLVVRNDTRSGDTVIAGGFANILQSHCACNEHPGLCLHG